MLESKSTFKKKTLSLTFVLFIWVNHSVQV